MGQMKNGFLDFADLAEASDIQIPTYGLRVLWGIDSDGDFTLCSNHVGTIEGVTLVGLLETLKVRLLEA
jgi:hypothetical protein